MGARLSITFFVSFAIFLGLLGCSDSNHSPAVHKDRGEFTQTSSQLASAVPSDEKANMERMQNNMKVINQLIEEFDLLLLEFQKNDELEDAIDMMKTAANEAQAILNKSKEIKTENDRLSKIQLNFEKELQDYITGLNLQIEGMESWDSQRIKEGLKLTQTAKTALKQDYEEINK